MMLRMAIAFGASIWLVSSTAGVAQTLEDRLRDQLRQTTLQLREAQDGQAALRAQKAAAEQERDALKKQVAELQAEVGHAKRGRDESEVDALKQEVGKYKDVLAQASQAAQQSQAEQQKLVATATTKDAMLTACEQKNAGLLKVSREILAEFESTDVLDALGLSEPVTQLSRVELENLAQDFGDRVYEGKFDPRMVKTAPPTQAVGASGTQTQPVSAPAGNAQSQPSGGQQQALPQTQNPVVQQRK